MIPDQVTVSLITRNYNWGNGSQGLTVRVAYDHDALPNLLQWQRFEEGCYVVGIEPCTVRPGIRSEQESRGEVRWLSHEQSYRYDLIFSVFASAP